MRISDWSSDVCSSDLKRALHHLPLILQREVVHQRNEQVERGIGIAALAHGANRVCPRVTRYCRKSRSVMTVSGSPPSSTLNCRKVRCMRSDEGRVGKECVSTGRHWWSASNEKKKKQNNR